MDIALTLVTLLAIAVAVSAAAGRLGMSAPLVLIVVGIVGSYLPFVPDFELTPELVLIGLLPPLLYAASIQTSLVDFRANRRPIALLSVGLVLFTTAGVGLLVWWLLDVPLAVALALGAVVAPPDAVAATSIARRVGLPRRVVTILEGESLVNDATAIVTLRASIAAIGGTVSVWEVGASFVLSAIGGALIGLLVAIVVGKIRKLIQDDVTDVAVSLLTPWIAYLPAEEIHIPGVEGHPSGVLAVVVAGIILGHKSPIIQSASSRLFERTNWSTISYVLENAIFLLIGLQVRSIVDDLGESTVSGPRIAVSCAAVLAAVILLRILWVFPATYAARMIPKIRDAEPRPSPRVVFLVAWTGMRGVVTLAAVFLLPEHTEKREVLVLMAFVVTIGTLLIQGLTIPTLVRLLKVPGPDRHEDHLQEATVYQAVADEGMKFLDEEVEGTVSDSVMHRLRERATDRTNAVWERLGGSATPSAQYSRLRAAMLARERDELLRIRALGSVDQSILARVMNALDVEESILDRMYEDETTANRETELRPTYEQGGPCEHLSAAVVVPPPVTPTGCEECLADGDEWVHLRLCMECGHVGCCDSSPNTHATKHFHESGHAVMRSFEPGEAWRWCYIDEVLG
ncbi:CPA1 family monovalent cation:H+ antiporter [Aeromicrobium panaciterrae]|uniref:CPA1 family monovalent cation:H+ antiporter n=1 Tax=Aeromicrobium panaciterrae TaxID=363861 RepID=A0ABU1ULV3_9ACTN|nr:Na+/H+ antiporter [Aeromicrobium panaciterrae]MDR7086166.1 CPA1 family monovalent cation:H+ antiporter [Aeromicrobium panaciterrae]